MSGSGISSEATTWMITQSQQTGLVGQVQDTLAREYGTGVWLCTNPVTSFNVFWKQRIPQVTNPFR